MYKSLNITKDLKKRKIRISVHVLQDLSVVEKNIKMSIYIYIHKYIDRYTYSTMDIYICMSVWCSITWNEDTTVEKVVEKKMEKEEKEGFSHPLIGYG